MASEDGPMAVGRRAEDEEKVEGIRVDPSKAHPKTEDRCLLRLGRLPFNVLLVVVRFR